MPVLQTPGGLRALAKDRPIDPVVRRTVSGQQIWRFASPVRRAMANLAAAMSPHELAAQAYALYEKFRPKIPAGVGGWGAAGVLDLDVIGQLARKQ